MDNNIKVEKVQKSQRTGEMGRSHISFYFFYTLFTIFVRPFLKIRFKRKIKRLEKPAIVLCNHGSFTDFFYSGIILRKDKSLTKTTFRDFYQNEHYADKIQFLLDADFMSDDDITTYTITLFVTLPKYNESTEEPVTHKAKYLTIDEELYKEK